MIKRLSLGYRFPEDKEVVSLIFINYFIIILFVLVVILIHTSGDELLPVSYRYHSAVVMGITGLLLIRWRWILAAKILVILAPPILLMFLPPLSGLVDEEFFFWFPYVPIALSLIPHFILKPVKEKWILYPALTFYFLSGLFIDDLMIFLDNNSDEIIPIVHRNRLYYHLIPVFIFSFVNLALGILFRQNARYEDIMKKQQDDLIRSEKMASLGVLTSGIAHEINNPLNYISGGLTLLEELKQDFVALGEKETDRKQEISQKMDEIIKTTYEGVFRAAEIVKNLRTFSSGQNSITREVNVAKLVESALLILHSRIPETVEVIRQYEPVEPVPCIEQKITQVFMNILDNALDALAEITGEARKFIRIINASRQINDEPFVLIRFENSGPPIAEGYIRKIFDPFFTTKEPGKGVGLGMSISYNIIREHKGTMSVYNKDNLVVFDVLLPARAK